MHNTLASRRGRRGLTLLELIVVLLILVALAGALIPLLTGLLARTHGAASADQLAELNKYLQHWQLETRRMPAGLDSLVEVDGVGLPGVGAATAYTGVASTGWSTPTDVTADALIDAGITTLVAHPTTFEDATFDAASSTRGGGAGTLVTLTAGDTVSLLGFTTTTGALEDWQQGLGLPDEDATYIVLGVGPDVEMVGKLLAEVPLHTSDDAAPGELYARYAVVLRYDATEESLTYVTVAALHDDELEGLRGHIAEYHESVLE